MERRGSLGMVGSPSRITSRLLLLVLIASTLSLAAADAFHDSLIRTGRVQAAWDVGIPEEEQASRDVTSFNGDVESESPLGRSRGSASQISSVQGGSVFTVRTAGSIEVENTEVDGEQGGRPFASADMDATGTVDDDEFDGDLIYRLVGQIRLSADHDGADGEGSFFLSFGPESQRFSMTDDAQTIQVDETAVDDRTVASFSIFTSMSLQGVVGLSVIEWDLTLRATASDICPAPEQADPAPTLELASPSLAAQTDSEDGAGVAQECSIATVGFRDPVVGGDGNITEDDEVASLPIVLSEPQEQQVQIGFGAAPMAGQEAAPVEDFDATVGSLVLAPGQTAGLILIPLIDDGDAEPDEAFGVLLFVMSGPAITARVDEIAQVIVRDDDCAMNMPNAGGPNIDVVVPDNLSGTVCGSIHPDQINGNDTINGNDFFGNPLGNVILGGAGDDVLFGGPFNDILAGGAGTDVVSGREGNDELWASNPTNPVIARTSNYITETTDGDSLFGNSGDDTLFGSSGANELYGGPGSDSLYGHGGSDQLFGQEDNDFLFEGPPFAAPAAVDINGLDGGTGGLVDVDVCFSHPASDVEQNCEV